MGVIRRDGGWRLVKKDKGVYEITYQKQPELRVLTADYQPDMFDQAPLGVPVREVESYAEAEGLFEEHAHGPDRGGFGISQPSSSASRGVGTIGFSESPIENDLEMMEDVEPLPLGGVALVLILAGGITAYIATPDFGSLMFLIGLIFAIGGVGVIGITAYLADDFAEALKMLLTVEEDSADGNRRKSDQEKTPPAPQSLKDELYFDRAQQNCEWCEETVDKPEIHHIESRSEGGPNDPENLIVLCPVCHRKADSGYISKTKLKAKMRRIT